MEFDRRVLIVSVIVCCFLEAAVFQTVFEAEDLVWKSFSDCCQDAGCQPRGLPNYYRHLSISNDDQSLWVGAMNFLFKLNITDLTCKAHKYLPVEEITTIRCTVQGKSKVPDCQNHIRTVIELNNEDMYVCGTGAYSPVNYTFNRQEVIVTETKPGTAFCPYDPLDNNTAIKIDHGNPWNSSALYFGTYSDFNKNFPVFYRPEYVVDGRTYLRKTTDIEDNNWLFAPQFVGSFDEDDSLFFFFRETAIETPSEERKIYSRVGKVCKKDQGGGQLEIAKTKWLSFQKARLNCSLPGNIPFYFDDVYDVYKQGDYYYALFYKQAGFLSASAICIYKKSDILQVFRGKFQHYNRNNKNWETLQTDPSPRLDNCSLYESNSNVFDSLRSHNQLMDSTVKPVYGQPIFYQHGVQWMKIIVGETKDMARNIYVASDECEIYDIFFKEGSTDSFTDSIVKLKLYDAPEDEDFGNIVENKEIAYEGEIYDIFFKEGSTDSFTDSIVKLNKIYAPFSASRKSFAVWNMKLLNNVLLLATDYNVTRLNLDVCSSIQNIDTCILDTQCQWNNCNKKCVSSTNTLSQVCIISHLDITHDQPIIDLLIEKNAIEKVLQTPRKGIVGIYTKLDILQKVSRKITRWQKALPDNPFEDLDMERASAKYALSWNGDLTIANTTYEDKGNYRAFDQDGNLIADYKLDVIQSEDEIIDAWKQQFSDWSMAFTRWKACSHDFFEGCVNRP